MGPEAERRAARTREWVETHDVVGLAIEELRRVAGGAELVIRVVSEDGVPQACTADRRFSRVTVETVGGVVSRVAGLY